MAAILKNGGHLGFEGVSCNFPKLDTTVIICTKFGACITKWTSLIKYGLKKPHYSWYAKRVYPDLTYNTLREKALKTLLGCKT